MIQFYRGEEFKEIKLEYSLQLKYAISNYGRLVSYKENLKDGNELKGGIVEGYKVFRYYAKIDGVRKTKNLLFYRLVAEYFLPKENEDQNFVLHLNYNKIDDHVRNLKWANQEQLTAHHSINPNVIAVRAKSLAYNIKADGRKLTSTQVIRFKKMLQRKDNKTRLEMIAKQFNITTQQLYRIRTVENWGHIKV